MEYNAETKTLTEYHAAGEALEEKSVFYMKPEDSSATRLEYDAETRTFATFDIKGRVSGEKPADDYRTKPEDSSVAILEYVPEEVQLRDCNNLQNVELINSSPARVANLFTYRCNNLKKDNS